MKNVIILLSVRYAVLLFAGSLVILTSGCSTQTVVSTPIAAYPASSQADPEPSSTTGAISAAPSDQTLKNDPKYSVEGIPYFLPTSVIEITVESQKDDKGKHKEMVLNTTAKLLPDRSHGFTLTTPVGATESATHQIKLQDSMLTLVSTDNDSKIGEIVGDLATIGADIYSFGAVGASAQGKKDLGYKKPTNSEITDALTSIAPGAHIYDFAKGQEGKAVLPGTENLVVLLSKAIAAFGGDDSNLPSPQGDPGGYNGIYVRILRAAKVQISINIRVHELFLKRIRDKTAAQKSAADGLPKLKEAQTKNNVKLSTLTAEKDDLATREIAIRKNKRAIEDKIAADPVDSQIYRVDNNNLEHVKEDLDAITAKITTNADALSSLSDLIDKNISDLKTANAVVADEPDEDTGSIKQNKEWSEDKDLQSSLYPITTHDAIALIPDENTLVKVPLTRSWLGQSTNSVSLQSGILIEYKTVKPSDALEFVKIPLNIAEKLVGLPAQILSLKIDYTNKQKDLVTANEALAKLKDQIAHAKDAPSSHDAEVTSLTQQKQILQLQSDIAVLQKSLDDLAKKP